MRKTFPYVRETWPDKAACRGQGDLFYAPDEERGEERALRERHAKELCECCAVLLKCRAFALENKELYGIWGGMTEQERKEYHRAADQKAG